jgi:hypothetical protein
VIISENFNDIVLNIFFRFRQQMTPAMSLESIQALFIKIKLKEKDTLLSIASHKLINMHQIYKKDFAQLKAIKLSDINDEFLSFFLIVVSYVKKEPEEDVKESLKIALILMFRIDHAIIYKNFIQEKLTEQLKCNFLIEIVIQLTSFKENELNECNLNFYLLTFESAQFK